MNNRRQLISDLQLFSICIIIVLPRLLFFTTLNALALLTELAVSVILCTAAYWLQKYWRGKAKKAVRTMAALLLPILFAGTVRELLQFTGKAAFHEVPLKVLLLMITGVSFYVASLRTEALARFSFLCTLYAAVVLTACVFFTLGKSKAEPLVWQWELHWYHLLDCLSLPTVYVLLAENGGNHRGRALAAGLLVPYAATSVFMLLSASLIGAAEPIYHYPLFVLFQLCEGRSFSGLDMLFISLALCCVTAKSGVLLCLFHRELLGGRLCKIS